MTRHLMVLVERLLNGSAADEAGLDDEGVETGLREGKLWLKRLLMKISLMKMIMKM